MLSALMNFIVKVGADIATYFIRKWLDNHSRKGN